MTRWYGEIGFGETVETAPSVFSEKIVSRKYYGEVIKNGRGLQTSDKVNDDLTISNQISVISDPYAMENFQSIRYATFMNSKWKVTDVTVEYPRLTLTLGGVYNAH